MTGTITLLDQPRTLDALARPTSAIIYFYLTGTTTLANIYSDAALTTPAANPILLSSGQFFPDIYLDPAISYRRYIQYGDGTIHDVDPFETSAATVLSVKSYGAVGNGVTNDRVAIQAALTYAGTLINGATVLAPPGTYLTSGGTLTIPSKVVLSLDGAKIVSSFANAITITVGNDGASGALVGTGENCIIEHSGTGSGVFADGFASQAGVYVSNIWIRGTSAGIAGLHFKRFNRGNVFNVKSTGYTAGDSVRHEGANSITHFGPKISTCLNGINNMGSTLSGAQSANAIQVFGGQITNCTGWGWIENTAGGGGRNLGNTAKGITFEANGTNASATTGDIFNQNCDTLNIDSNYFENGVGIVPTNCITIGDATNGPKNNRIVGNQFGNTNTNTINDFNGQTVSVEGNTQNGANTNFVNHGTLARNIYVGINRTASTNYFAGFDTGLDSVVIGGAGTFLNQQGPTIRGYGHNVLSGFNQDLVIRTRGGGSNSILFQDQGGSSVASVADNGVFNTTQNYQVNSQRVVGARLAALPADATDLATALTLVNAIKARMKVTGGHGLVAD